MLIAKVFLVFMGSFFGVLGIGRIVWEFHSWSTLSHLGQRPPLIGDDPRVVFHPHAVLTAVGVTLLCLAFFI